jgi:hypothetical protein
MRILSALKIKYEKPDSETAEGTMCAKTSQGSPLRHRLHEARRNEDRYVVHTKYPHGGEVNFVGDGTKRGKW